MANVPITYGAGQASIAGETIGTVTYQIVKVVGGETGSTSVLGVNPDRSINVSVLGTLTVNAALQAPSVVGTYAEDSPSANLDKGLFVLGVRNDTLASVTSADGDYGALSLGPSGEAIVANAPLTKWIQGTADLRVVLGTSVAVLAAQGTSVFTYVTAIQIGNMGPASVLVTLTGGLGSVLGYTIAPAGGGSNIYYPNGLKTGANSQFAASISGTASVLVSAQGFISKS